jgi:hypothetical protein
MLLWRQGTDLKRRAEWLASQTFVVLAIQIPKKNDKGPASIEQFFAALHGIFRDDPQVQEYVSLEIVAEKESIIFYVFTPIHLREFIEGQLYAQYPDLEIKQVPDYTSQAELEGLTVATTDIQLVRDEVFPIKTYPTIEVDPLAGITAVMAKLEDRERIWLQLLVQPVGDTWQDKGVKYIQALREGKDPEKKQVNTGLLTFAAGKAGRFVTRVVREAVQPGTGLDDKAPVPETKLTAPQEAAIKGIENKIQKPGYETLFRLTIISTDEITARSRVQAVLAALKQFNATALNGFSSGQIHINDFPSWQQYINREFEQNGKILNIEELASVFHFPTAEVETSAISWSGSKKGEAPFNVPLKSEVDPLDLTVLGLTDFRNQAQEFGIKLNDRKRHVYIIGKSGTGKSTLLENMIIDDMFEGRGVIVIDPHGELADKCVESVPEHRIKDVVLVDPADRDFPVAFNPLESVGDDFKPTVASGFVGIFKKIFGNSWGPRLEYILRNTVLALLDTENATMLGIPRMLTESAFRQQVIEQIKDAVIKDFWVYEFSGWSDQQRNEAIAPILNKVGQFLSTTTIRNIVGQPKSTIDIRHVMDNKKILIVNLSKGKIGEDNMALLGSMIVTKVQLAAMSRADVAADQRPDSFLYVDEFQNFATESFATILSEARKYNLGLTIAHQYIAQMTEEVKDAVIGNVGTIITFRVGAPDAAVVEKELAPIFEANDIVNLQIARVYIKLLIDGIAAPAFSAQTLPPRQMDFNHRKEVVEWSRSQFAQTRGAVEEIIDDVAGYKRRREAEEAAKEAAKLLQQAPPPARPNAAMSAAPVRALPADAAFKPVTNQAPSNFAPRIDEPVMPPPGSTEQKPKKPPVERPLKIMNGRSYKELSQRGGQKWFVGEPEAEAVARRENRRAIEQERALRGEGGENTAEIEVNQHPEPISESPMAVIQEPQLPQVYEEVVAPAVIETKSAEIAVQDSLQPPTPLTVQTPNTDTSMHDVPREVWDAALGDEEEIALREGDELRL